MWCCGYTAQKQQHYEGDKMLAAVCGAETHPGDPLGGEELISLGLCSPLLSAPLCSVEADSKSEDVGFSNVGRKFTRNNNSLLHAVRASVCLLHSFSSICFLSGTTTKFSSPEWHYSRKLCGKAGEAKGKQSGMRGGIISEVMGFHQGSQSFHPLTMPGSIH